MTEEFVTTHLLNLERLLENIEHLQTTGAYNDEMRFYLRATFERELRATASMGFELDALHYVVRYAEMHKRVGD